MSLGKSKHRPQSKHSNNFRNFKHFPFVGKCFSTQWLRMSGFLNLVYFMPWKWVFPAFLFYIGKHGRQSEQTNSWNRCVHACLSLNLISQWIFCECILIMLYTICDMETVSVYRMCVFCVYCQCGKVEAIKIFSNEKQFMWWWWAAPNVE